MMFKGNIDFLPFRALMDTITLMNIQSLDRVEGTPRKLRKSKVWSGLS